MWNIKKVGLMLLVPSFLLISCGNKQSEQNNEQGAVLGQGTETSKWYFDHTVDYLAMNPKYQGPKWLFEDQPNDGSTYSYEAYFSEISANGRYMVFSSRKQLVNDAPKEGMKLYRCSLAQSGGEKPCNNIELVSRRPANVVKTPCGDLLLPSIPANGDFIAPSISNDGNRIAFVGQSLEIAPEVWCDFSLNKPLINDNKVVTYEIYLADLTANTIEKVSENIYLDQDVNRRTSWEIDYHKPSISGNGEIVAYTAKSPQIDAGIVPPTVEDNDDFEQIFLYNTRTKETSWASRPTTALLPKGRGGDSTSPQLNYDGSIVVFTSFAKLVPEDQTYGCVPDDQVSNVYMAKFMTGTTLGPEIKKRTSLELVSVDKGSDKSTGCNGSSYSSITSDGRLVMFMSTKAPSKIADIRKNDIGASDPIYPQIQVYIRDMSTKQTSMVGLSVFKNNDGSKTFKEIKADVFYPTISSNGNFALFTTMAPDVYMDKKMKRFADKEIVSGTNNDCAHMTISGSENTSHIWLSDTSSRTSGFVSGIVKGGWRDVQSADCLPALHPNNWNQSQVYRITLNGLQVTDVLPISTTPPLAISTWFSNYDTKNLAFKDGQDVVISQFGRVYQVHYGNLNSLSGADDASSRLVLDDGTAIFHSSAANLTNEKEDFSVDRTPSGYYQALPPNDVSYTFSETPDEYEKYYNDDAYAPFYPSYKGVSLGSMSTFIYPASRILGEI